MTSRPRSPLVLLGLLACGLGCANRITRLEPPPGSSPRIGPIPAPLALDWVETRRGGVETNPSRELVALCVESLSDPGTFSDVLEPRRAHTAPAQSYRLSLRIEEEFDRRPISNLARLLAIGLPGGVGGLLVPFYFDDRMMAEGALTLPDSAVRTYRVSVAATIRTSALRGLGLAEYELRDQLFRDALRALTAAITTDASLVEGEAPR